MRHLSNYCVLTLLLLFVHINASAQSEQPFDISAYKSFLDTHKDMTADQLRSLHPAGSFAARAETPFGASSYADSIVKKYGLTDDERSLIEAHGFMVTERLKRQSFGDAFAEVFHNDLPVFISADAILHALHMSYDAMVRDVEERTLSDKLGNVLASMHDRLPALAAKYSGYPGMAASLRDADVYLTVPRKLLGQSAAPVFPENGVEVDSLMTLIAAEQPALHKLFSTQHRWIDFSQFTVRGHYTQTEKLQKYFRAMMWLGRTELYLIAPVNSDPPVTDENIRRQVMTAALIAEAVHAANAGEAIREIDDILRYFVGESDNVTLSNMEMLLAAAGIDSVSRLLDDGVCAAFQDSLAKKSFAFQRILSQIIMSDPSSPDNIRPASAFLLFGQRFIVDSYVTGSVVYDKIVFEGRKIWRPLPSRYDILFALGNDAAAQLLEQELSTYHYASNLASLRYLVDAYESDYWNSTIYTGWLNSIRALNPPPDRSSLPPLMKTAAWWQMKMNTQLSSWAQLRHDNLLYAKQSYTGGIICSYPESYVEPVPEFFAALRTLASIAREKFPSLGLTDWPMQHYWENLETVADTLRMIAQKEVDGSALSDADRNFLKRMLYLNAICGPKYNGWYYQLFYTGDEGFFKDDKVVADVHTCPTDEAGSLVGWVLHGGTGPVNLAVVTAPDAGGRLISYVGPVMSYYEHVSANFQRLTDEEWGSAYNLAPSFRPDFVNLYLADSLGNSRGSGSSLVMGTGDRPADAVIPRTPELGQNYPNPFNASTIITFSIPRMSPDPSVELVVYDVQGRRIRQLLHQTMPAGSYAARWDGTMQNGGPASSGTYFYHLIVGGKRLVGKMSLLR